MTMPSFGEYWDALTATRQAFSFADMFGTQLSVAPMMRPIAAIASVLGADRGLQIVGDEHHLYQEQASEEIEYQTLSV